MIVIKTEVLSDVKEYYGKKYRPILNAFENKKVKLFQIDESCGKYLELYALMENGNKIFVNHGISNSNPYNVTITPAHSWDGKETSYRCSSMIAAANYIIKEEYDW